MNKTFYGLDKKAGYKVWNITVKAGAAGDAYLVIEHGKENGKLTEKVDYKALMQEYINIRQNETNN